MKIGFFGVQEEDKKNFYKQSLAEHELTFIDGALSENKLPEQRDFEIICIFVDCKITSKIIDQFPKLKYITTRSTGFDHIDYEYANKKNIYVSNVPNYGSHTVAEFTFGLILSLLKNLNKAMDRTKLDHKFNYENLRGMNLYEKTLGVIGTGKIGNNVIKIAKGFEMDVVATDLHPSEKFAASLGFKYVNLNELLSLSDIVSVHIPANPQTYHLINSGNISRFKKGSYLINTARGSIVESQALFDALDKDILAGAALDVLEDEDSLKNNPTLLANHFLINHPKVIVTPHMAFYTKEAEENIMKTTINNVKSFINNSPLNQVGK